MTNAESPTRDCSLAALPVGVPALVVGVDDADARRLIAHGVRGGAVLTVEQEAPFGGPRIVRLGSARLALARTTARSVTVRPGDPLPTVGR